MQTVEINRKTVLNALKELKKIKTVNSLIITDNFMFSVKENVLKITANNLQQQLTHTYACESKTSFNFLFSKKEIETLLNKLKDETLLFTASEKEKLDDKKKPYKEYFIEVTHSKGKMSFQVDSFEDYPRFSLNEAPKFEFENIFSEIITKASKFVGKDELRPQLTGVNLSFNKENLFIDATNSHFLYRKTIPFIADKEVSVNIPSESVPFIGNGKIEVFEDKIVNTYDNVEFITRTITEKFPNFTNVIREKSPIKLKTQTSELIEAIEINQLAENKTTHKQELQINKDTFVYAEDIDLNKSSKVKINTNNLSNTENFTIGFNSELFLKVLKNINDKSLIIDMESKDRAFQIETSEDEIFVLMPVLLQ